MKTREKTYKNRIRHYKNYYNKIQTYYNFTSNLRFISFSITIVLYFIGENAEPSFLYFSLSLLFLLIFIVGVIFHNKLAAITKKLKTLIAINQDGISRVQGDWSDFPVTGKEFLDHNQPHLSDLNILGKNSIFQMIQLTSTSHGAKQLANWLSFCNDFSSIQKRQQAVKEISSKVSMRQHLLMEGLILEKKLNPEKFLNWVKTPSLLNKIKPFVALQKTIVPTTLFLIGLSFFFNFPSFWIVSLLIQTIVFLLTLKKYRSYYIPALDKESLFIGYEKMFNLLENENFKTEFLINVQNKLIVKDKTISHQMKRLQRINSSLCLCYSSMYIFINILLLWDIYFLYKLECWKKDMQSSIDSFFKVLGEVEAISSIAGFYYDNHDYKFPVVSGNNVPFLAKKISHPLISADERVYNDFIIPKKGFLGLITGSNMSGKSTFIRTVGINLRLAFAGAPIAAEKLVVRPCIVMSCIEVHDSLSKHISHFYAEVKGIKKILNTIFPNNIIEPSLPILYLIDEIFSGTNTKERLLASEGIILKLTESKSYGLLTTHDLDLTKLEKKSQNIKNFHFQDEIDQNKKMYFNYKIKNGPVNTTNALKILEIEGISFS